MLNVSYWVLLPCTVARKFLACWHPSRIELITYKDRKEIHQEFSSFHVNLMQWNARKRSAISIHTAFYHFEDFLPPWSCEVLILWWTRNSLWSAGNAFHVDIGAHLRDNTTRASVVAFSCLQNPVDADSTEHIQTCTYISMNYAAHCCWPLLSFDIMP